MSDKISHARIAELEEKIKQREGIEAKIRTMQEEMHELKERISKATEAQLQSSSDVARTRRRKPVMNLSFQNEVEALELSTEKLRNDKAKIEEEIKLLKGWG